MSFFDPNTFDDAGQDDDIPMSYPLINYVYGNQQLRRLNDVSYTGGFFISSQSTIVDEMPSPWEAWDRPVEASEQNGHTGIVEGWAAQSLVISILGFRRRWVWQSGRDFGSYRWANGGYEQALSEVPLGVRPTGQLQILVAIKDHDDPYVLSFKGAGSQSMGFGNRSKPMFLSQVNQVRQQLRNLLIKEMPKKRRIGIPTYSFYFHIGPEMSEKGEPIFQKRGPDDAHSKMLSLPVAYDLNPSDLTTMDAIETIGVPAEIRTTLYKEWAEAARDWIEEWDSLGLKGNQPQPEHAQGGAPHDEGGDTSFPPVSQDGGYDDDSFYNLADREAAMTEEAGFNG